jgi:hypothetical protein
MLADRGFVPLALPVVVAAVVSFGLLVSASAGRVHKRSAPGTSLGVRLAGAALVVLIGALVAPAALALLTGRAGLTRGALAVERGMEAARQGNVDAATKAFDQAQRAFATASDRLESPLATPGLAVPVLGPNLA